MRPLGVVGNLSRDRVDGGPPRVGGPPFHATRALRAIGRPSVVATKLAEADKPLLLPPLLALGIPVEWRPAQTTAAFEIAYDGDARTMEIEAVGDPWTPEEARGWVAEALGRAEWVHVGPIARSDFPPETLAELARGRRLSLDVQGLLRPARTGPLELDADFDREVFRHVSVLKLAEEEAQTLVGEPDEQALRSLGVREVVVTLGPRGSLVLTDEGLERVAAHELQPRDPTGAGDAFAAAYLASRAAGLRPRAAARRATALVAELLR
ncbi:MAG: PfkB family carbohydrate kinase [Gaiellaceae bacterium]